MKTVVLTGPECSGKSTLARALAQQFTTVFVQETARDYALTHKGPGLDKIYGYEEIEFLAERHMQAVQTKRAEANHILFVDTHLIVFKIWFLWAHQRYPDWIDREIKDNPCSLYLLCEPDIPWEYDPARQHGGTDRLRLFELYRDELDKQQLPWRPVNGMGEQRTECAAAAVLTAL